MIHTSINALIGLQLTQFIKNKKLLSTSIIIGIILPDIDLILDFILSLFYNYGNRGVDFFIVVYNSSSIVTSWLGGIETVKNVVNSANVPNPTATSFSSSVVSLSCFKYKYSVENTAIFAAQPRQL